MNARKSNGIMSSRYVKVGCMDMKLNGEALDEVSQSIVFSTLGCQWQRKDDVGH